MSQYGGKGPKDTIPCNPLPAKDISHITDRHHAQEFEGRRYSVKTHQLERLYLYLSASSGKYWLGAAGKALFSTSFSYTLSLQSFSLNERRAWNGSEEGLLLPNEKKNIRINGLR